MPLPTLQELEDRKTRAKERLRVLQAKGIEVQQLMARLAKKEQGFYHDLEQETSQRQLLSVLEHIESINDN